MYWENVKWVKFRGRVGDRRKVSEKKKKRERERERYDN